MESIDESKPLDKKSKNNIEVKKKLLFTETILACGDMFCLLITSLTLSWQGLFIGYILMCLTSPLEDPIWGSIMSANKVNKKVFGSSI